MTFPYSVHIMVTCALLSGDSQNGDCQSKPFMVWHLLGLAMAT